MTQKRILAIEDDGAQRAVIQKVLEKRDYGVLVAETGEEGIEMALENKPDLILLDVIMPGISGHDVCRALKNDSRTKDIPILFLTSANSPKDVIEQYDLGGEVHLAKPINAKELIDQIEVTFEESLRSAE